MFKKIFPWLFQSPNLSGFKMGKNENPALLDNWDDAEGYYSKLIISFGNRPLLYSSH